jgi:hypothetical protein
MARFGFRSWSNDHMTTSVLTSKTAIASLSFALGLTLAGGVAAVAATKAGPVKACESTKGFLATATKGKCPRGTHLVTLGARGQRGAKGKKGMAGTAGLSVDYLGSDLTANLAGGQLTTTPATVLLIPKAPAGNYVVTYNYSAVAVGGDLTDSGRLQCQLFVGAQGERTTNQYLAGGASTGTVTAVATVFPTAAGSLSVKCAGVGGSVSGINAQGGSLAAIQINSLVIPTG